MLDINTGVQPKSQNFIQINILVNELQIWI